MKKLFSVLTGLWLSASATSVLAEEIGGGVDLTMNVALTTDYVWRGISQTDNKGAVQGGLDLNHNSGAYIGTWASNVDFGSDASAEWDWYLGYAGEVANFAYDVGYVAYTYTGESGLNFSEWYASVGVMGATFGTHYSDDSSVVSNKDDSTFYWYLAYDHEINDWGIHLNYGQYDYKDPTFGNDSDYNEYKIGVSYSVVGVDLGLDYTDTNIDSANCGGGGDHCDGIVAFSVGKTL